MVLCAGYGSRLRPLTDELPKPLLPLGDRSFLRHALDTLRGAGFNECVANVHHLPHVFERHLAELGGGLRLVQEPDLRGTAGGIAGARAWLGPAPVVAMIGDALLGGVPPELCERARSGGLVLALSPRPAGNGTVGVGAQGQVVRLRGERFGDEVSGGEYVGLCALGAAALAALPDRGCLIGDFALPWLRQGGEVRTCAFEYSYTLPGDELASYLASQWAWLAAQSRNEYVGPGVKRAATVELEQCVIHAGAELSGSGALRRVLACSGARVEAPLSDAIVLPSGAVVYPFKS
ncbi:MAG: sugar phosphate nucleotidyltransferase [Polyangiaceae bacterium]